MTQSAIETVEETTTEQPGSVESRPPLLSHAHKYRLLLRIVVAVALVAALFLLWRIFFAARIPDGIVTLSGRIEGDDSAVACKTNGRILEIHAREGDSVKAGEVIAVLDDQQVRARQEQASAAVLGAEAREKAARSQIEVLHDQLQQNRLQTQQAAVDATGRVRQAEADLSAAEADLAQQEAAYQLASFDKDAYSRLAKTGAVSERQGKLAVATADQQAAAVTAARRRTEAARGALTTAQANLSNAGIHQAQTSAVRMQITQQQAEIASANANAQQARAQLIEAQANLKDLTVTAPFDGTVMTRAAEPGEVVQAGTAIVTLLDLRKVYLRGFVPEGQIGRIQVGQKAHVYLDSNPKHPLDATVMRIDPEAAFTPENTYFKDDRVKQVVGVKLLLQSGTGFAKPGMPSDAEILVQGYIWPKSEHTK